MLDIIHLLTGDESFPPSLDSMVMRYIEKRRFDFEQIAWYAHYIDKSRAVRLMANYEHMSDQAKLHFLLSPASYEAGTEFNKNPDTTTLDAIIRFLELERTIDNGTDSIDETLSEPIWNAMGDKGLHMRDGACERVVPAFLDDLIVIDFDSPHATDVRPTSPLMYRPAEAFTQDERAAVIAKLRKALDKVDEIVPTFGHLIRNYTRAIRIRKCERLSSFASEHVTNTIGEIRLLNAQKEEYGVDRLAEALIHESVHNLLSTYEFLNQPFVFSHDERQYRPVSPWSGNPIPVASFCHAVLVWFALFNYALKALEVTEPGTEQYAATRKRRNQYASGFLIPTKLSSCIENLAMYSAIILPTLDQVQVVVRNVVSPPSESAFEAKVLALA